MIRPDKPQVNRTDKFSVTQAARVLGVHVNTFIRWADSMQLVYSVSKVNGRRYFSGTVILDVWRTMH